MTEDEQKIRHLVSLWMHASTKGDLAAVLTLMTDDVVFQTVGAKPFGREKFATASTGMKNMKVEGSCNIQEIEVHGNWAWMRNKLRVAITPPNGQEIVKAGYTLTILRKDHRGHWAIARDANLLVDEKPKQHQ